MRTQNPVASEVTFIDKQWDEARWVARRSQAGKPISKAQRLRSTDPIQKQQESEAGNKQETENWREQTGMSKQRSDNMHSKRDPDKGSG